MKLFIDSADINEIKAVAELAICDGVTTNPSLVAKTNQDFKSLLREVSNIIAGPLSAEVVSSDYTSMLEEAEQLRLINENIVIKLPLTPNGLKACKSLSGKGIKTNVTLCFHAGQALLAAKCGATYISPFIGRLDDISQDGMQLIRDIKTVYKNYNFDTKILAASIRHPRHIIESALAGADVATCPYKILMQLYQHPLTESGLEQFAMDWEKSGQKI
ncbi:MAG: fructose-6-phosphate aldolase [Silvanigrellaceae bacterium]|nr:fructose-6-phosphate aldolase [Silvanigrellaceae bacterium]